MELDSALARQAFESADRAREADRHPDALTVLRVALSVLEDAGADRLTRLRAMGVYSRMVQAIKPLPPPSAKSFRAASFALRPRRPASPTVSSWGPRSASGSGCCSWALE